MTLRNVTRACCGLESPQSLRKMHGLRQVAGRQGFGPLHDARSASWDDTEDLPTSPNETNVE